jgi:hypothetical protein
MPAKNPRLTITLSPTLHAQLRKLSELTGNSQSALIAELLEGSEPTFARLIAVLTAAEVAKGALRGSITADIAEAQAQMEGQLGLMLETFDGAAQPLLDEAERIKRRSRGAGGARRASGAPAGAPTPMSNRGVWTTDKPPAKTRKTTRRRGKNGPV